MTLDLHSERFSPDGNLSAEGFENLIGTPSLDLLAVLVREAVQNSCDATRPEAGHAEVLLRVRALGKEERRLMREEVFSRLPEEETAQGHLQAVLEADEPLEVLEIADFGTTGLAGPTRADVPAQPGENPDFVNFFRNVGAARDVEGGGGTYGYGKSTLYRASGAHAIVVDTLTTFDGRPVRRFMAAQMGRAVPGQLTGRHWWGRRASDGSTVEPVEDKDARHLAEGLGMPRRNNENPRDMGTTIMILAPLLPASREEVKNALTENLLWYFWPRLMETAPHGRKLSAFVAHDRQELEPVPKVEEFPPLDLLCHAMNAIRGRGKAPDGVDARLEPIRSERPRRDLGQLAIAKSRAGTRRWLLAPPIASGEQGKDQEDEKQLRSRIPETLHHVALMRPAQLVVRYELGTPDPDMQHEWGGVFMCSAEQEIEQAFARSEPPAHDDWQPEMLPKRSMERRFVNIALRRIRERISSRPSQAGSAGATESPLGRASTLLGRLLPGAQGDGGGRSRHTRRGSGGSNLQPYTQPRAERLLLGEDGEPLAELAFDVNPAGVGRTVAGIPQVLVDGSLDDPDESTGVPEIRTWIAPDGEASSGASVRLHVPGRWLVRASIPGEVAVGLRLRDETEA